MIPSIIVASGIVANLIVRFKPEDYPERGSLTTFFASVSLAIYAAVWSLILSAYAAYTYFGVLFGYLASFLLFMLVIYTIQLMASRDRVDLGFLLSPR